MRRGWNAEVPEKREARTQADACATGRGAAQCVPAAGRAPLRFGSGFLFVEEFFDAGYVFGDVDADGVVLDLGDADFPAVFKPAELFELFDSFKFSLG